MAADTCTMTWPKAASNPEVGTVQDPLLDTHLTVAQFQAAYGASDAVMMSIGMSKTTSRYEFFFFFAIRPFFGAPRWRGHVCLFRLLL